MKEIKIYTAGKMASLTFEQQMNWRLDIEACIKYQLKESKIEARVNFIHPPLFYTYGENYHQTEKEIKDWEITQIRESDIVIVSLAGLNSSVGTHFELATADAINSFGQKHIYVIGVGEPEEELHPWIQLSLHRTEKDFILAADYIVNYLFV